MSVYNQTGKVPKGLETTEVPPEAEKLWDWFWQLHTGRGSNGFSQIPISYTELAAWAQLFDTAPTPWEVGVLKKMDVAFLQQSAKKAG